MQPFPGQDTRPSDSILNLNVTAIFIACCLPPAPGFTIDPPIFRCNTTGTIPRVPRDTLTPNFSAFASTELFQIQSPLVSTPFQHTAPAVIPRIHLPGLGQRIAPDINPAALGTLPLDPDPAHHLLRVLRRRAGDAVDVFDGEGNAWRAELADTKPATIRLLERLPAEAPPRLELCLAQCLSSAEKMDWTIEKAVELGVTRIVPLLSARSVVKLDASRAERRLQHWQRLVVAAAMQCGRNRLPEISAAQPLQAWLGTLPAVATDERRWVLSPTATQSLVTQASAGSAPIRSAWLLCGPESGLSEDELASAQAAGWLPALLGPRVLRTETAGLVGLSVLQALLGDLGDSGTS